MPCQDRSTSAIQTQTARRRRAAGQSSTRQEHPINDDGQTQTPEGDSRTGAEPPTTPAQAWAALAAGNERFYSEQLAHPHQDSARRGSLTAGQKPFAVFFGCGDSRVAAEVIFDCGLGDLFVVRTAGHVTDPGVLGSIEFGVEVLSIPLVVVLAHDSCGAIAATIESFETGVMPGGFMRDIVERISPSMLAAHRDGLTDPDEIGAEHVRQTIALLTDRSQIIARAVEEGRLAIVGAAYALQDGRARVVGSVGL